MCIGREILEGSGWTGNPDHIDEANVTDRMMKQVFPGLQPGQSRRRSMSRLRVLGRRLQMASKVCCRIPVVMSQRRIVLLPEADASSGLLGENATDSTESEWPARVYKPVFQDVSTCGNRSIHPGSSASNCLRIIA